MQTEPPPTTTFSQTVNQWIIYDSYVDYEYQKDSTNMDIILVERKMALERTILQIQVFTSKKL